MRKDISFVRFGFFAALFGILVWVGWTIIRDTVAQNLAVVSPDKAVRWVANQPIALRQLASKEIISPNGDLKAARAWAQAALRISPLDDRAMLLLGLIAERNHDDKHADALAHMAGERTWRNAGTQLWLFDRAVRNHDYVQAVDHADAVLRPNFLDPKFREAIFPTLTAFTGYAPSFKALGDFLITAPPWREGFLAYLSGHAPNKARLDQLYIMLKESAAPPTKAELRPYLFALIDNGRYAKAHEVWKDSLPDALRERVHYLFNGDFRSDMDGSPFNWTLTSQVGADIDIVGLSEGQKSLRIEFSGARVNFANVRQLMVLPPGRYSFSGKVSTAYFRASRGLWWRVLCAGEAAKPVGHTELITGNVPWTDFGMEFAIPQDCPAQWLQLELPARIEPEKQIDGQIWFQSLRIAPITGQNEETPPVRP